MHKTVQRILDSARRLAEGDRILREDLPGDKGAEWFLRKESSLLLRRVWRYWWSCRFRRHFPGNEKPGMSTDAHLEELRAKRRKQ